MWRGRERESLALHPNRMWTSLAGFDVEEVGHNNRKHDTLPFKGSPKKFTTPSRSVVPPKKFTGKEERFAIHVIHIFADITNHLELHDKQFE